MHKQRVHVLFLQETHIKTSSALPMPTRHFAQWYFSNNPVSKSRGVAIGFHNSLPVSDVQVVSDPGGIFLILKCKINNMLFTLINVYAPNQGLIPMLLRLLRKLDHLAESRIVLGGDLNIIFDPLLLDTTSIPPRFSLSQLN